MKKLLINLVKYGVSLGLIAYLVIDAGRDQSFSRLVHEPKNYSALFAAFVLCMAAVVLTFVRWYFLVRALELRFTMKDAFRLGFLGYLFNFVSLGSVGGDLFKAIFIAREQPGRRAQAVATVVVDRILGLYALFLLASFAVWVTDLPNNPGVPTQIRDICRATYICTLLGAVFIVLLIVPGFTSGRVSDWLTAIPRIGGVLGQLIDAIRMYRRKLPVLGLAIVMSLIVQSLFALGLYMISRGLPGESPSLGAHFVIVPLGMVAGALPLPMSGLGAFEYVIDFLYQNVPSGVVVSKGQGLLVCLTYRVITVVIAMIGVGYYLAARREVSQVLHEAEESPEPPLSPLDSSEPVASHAVCR